MKLLSADIRNYKCFKRSGEIRFASRFNIFIGQNDAGKSALLEAIGARVAYAPHRSLPSAPTPETADELASVFVIKYLASSGELEAYFRKQHNFSLPINRSSTHQPDINKLQEDFVAVLKEGDEFTVFWETTSATSIASPLKGSLLGLSNFNHEGTFGIFGNSGYPLDIRLSYTNNGGGNAYGIGLAKHLAEFAYGFRAERLILHTSASRGSEILAPNASNLPEVLNILQTRHTHLWRTYQDHVRTIFPHITEIKAVFQQGNQVEILISTAEPSLARADLDVSLAHSGTGIGQVLAILYIAVRNTHPHVILIDEPQSFLHPGALRKLLEILRQYSQHQYILTTHSPLALSMSDVDKMFQVVRGEAGSIVKEITEKEELIEALADVGVRLSDVYGAESILWVEGPTEERCFPELIRGLAKRPLEGAVILGVVATGELEGKDAKRVCEIYERLANSSALLPKPVAFLFDREKRSDQEMADLSKRLGGLMHWLPFRMYENYLIQPEAVAQVLSDILASPIHVVTGRDIEEWLESNGNDKKYFAGNAAVSYHDSLWKIHVHGARVLADLFHDKTSGLHEYQKVKHGLQLTRFLIASPTADMQELAQALGKLLDEQH
jgi:predicted ATPase